MAGGIKQERICVGEDPPQSENTITKEEPMTNAKGGDSVTLIAPIPTMEDPEWEDYILKQFMPEELDRGLPKANGLRRLVRKNIGPIISGKVHVCQVPTIDNEHRSTVEYELQILNIYNLQDGESPYVVTYSEAADAYLANVKGQEFARFPVAMASTRAQTRALRFALNLSKVSSEECTDMPLEASGFSKKITINQIESIDVKCQQLDIDVLKFIAMGKKKYKKMEDVSHEDAVSMFKLINLYQQQKKDVPDDIIGYDPDWAK
jgi:hypothetical protein